MHFLVIGSGGREHAITWKLSKSPIISKLTVAPGSDAISELAECVKLDVTDHHSVIEFCKENKVDLVFVGPEAPLVDGVIDSLQAVDIKCFGPSKYAAQLEGSKSFTKELCTSYNIPTAAYSVHDNLERAVAYLKQFDQYPIVLKADGLAAGKGVIIAENEATAISALEDIFDGAFGAAGSKVVIEEFLQGEEASLFVITDGKETLILPPAQDHKRAFDGDQGPNTGGMGAYAPTPVISSSLVEQAMNEIVHPTLRGLSQRGHPFTGVLYTGLMITKYGPKLIEYNARFGDPECQVLMMLLEEDLAQICLDVANKRLKSRDLTNTNESAVCIVMAAKGYPGAYEKGTVIEDLPRDSSDEISNLIFHAGTKKTDTNWVSAGGRVLNVCAKADSFELARNMAYETTRSINWQEGFFRTDIGKAALS